jgi:putative SOS response-associated peptidase YedK
MIKSLAIAAMLYTPQVDSVDTEFNRAEIIITLEDMSEWMRQDVDNETIDPRLAEIYIGHFNTLIKQVKEL